jgi:hypothetical protein
MNRCPRPCCTPDLPYSRVRHKIKSTQEMNKDVQKLKGIREQRNQKERSSKTAANRVISIEAALY